MTTPDTAGTPLFCESGASWNWVLIGPAATVALLLLQNSGGYYRLQPLILALFLVLVSGFIAIQIKAARIHTSVELTEETLREGTETIAVRDIVSVYPEPPRPTYRRVEPEKWQEARALGELRGVPRRRTGIGLRLTGGRIVQAWARNHRGLRAALGQLVIDRIEPGCDDTTDDTNEEQW